MRQESARLIVREYTPNDFDAVHAYGSDPLVVKYMLWGPNSLNESQTFIEMTMKESEVSPRTSYNLAIQEKQSDAVIGGISLSINALEAEIGWILNQQSWGKGYATEAAQALIVFGFDTLKLIKITATCDSENSRSSRVMTKCGMTQVDYQAKVRVSPHFSDQKRDQQCFEITSVTYQKLKNINKVRNEDGRTV